MNSDKKSEVGSLDWFINTLPLAEHPSWDILAEAEADGVTSFEAVHTAFMYAVKSGWKLYRSNDSDLQTVENLVKTYIENHANIPYIGRSIRTTEPISCIEGEITDTETGGRVYCKFAYWGNGGIYYLTDSRNPTPVYILMVAPTDAKIFQYPDLNKEEQ